MQASINTVILLGAISKPGVAMRYSQNGSPCANLVLYMEERSVNDQIYTTKVPVEVWGKRAEDVSELPAGQLVTIHDKLKRAKKNEVWETLVTTFDATPVGMTPSTSHTASEAF